MTLTNTTLAPDVESLIKQSRNGNNLDNLSVAEQLFLQALQTAPCRAQAYKLLDTRLLPNGEYIAAVTHLI